MDVLGRIQELMNQRGWSTYQLAKRTGKPVNLFTQMFQRNTTPTISTLEVICSAFGISLSQFFAMGEGTFVLTERESNLINIYNSLDESSKCLLDIYICGLARVPFDKTTIPQGTQENTDDSDSK